MEFSEVPTDVITETQQPHLDIGERLRSAGISFKPIGFDEVRMVNSRDFDGQYSYINGLQDKYGDTLQAEGLWVKGYLVGYGIGGIFERDGKRLAEIGMTHISPAVRDFGLGTLVSLYLRQGLLTERPDGFYTAVGDETGKVEHIVKSLGYDYKGHSAALGSLWHPSWQKDFTSEEDRKAFETELNLAMNERVARLLEKKDSLLEKVEEVDRDNPYKVDIEELVNQRLEDNVLRLGEKTRNGISVFGYEGGNVHLSVYKPRRNLRKEYDLYLRVNGAGKDKAQKVLNEIAEGSTFRCFESSQWVDIAMKAQNAQVATAEIKKLAHAAKMLI